MDTIIISTNYDALGAAAAVQTTIQSQFNTLTNGFVDRSVTNSALNRLAQNDGSALTGLNATALSTGTVPATQMPAYTGDITTAAGSTATTLKSTGTPGTYTKVTTDAAGRVTAGAALSISDLPSGYNNGGNAAVATNAVAGGNIMMINSAPTLSLDTNALYFANSMGISDLQTRADLVGMLNEIQSSIISNSVVAAHSFLPRFNPNGNTNGIFTIYGHYPIAFSNSSGVIFNRFGLIGSNTLAKIYNLPDCRTNTQIYVWSSPINIGGAPLGFCAGLINSTADEMLALTVNGNSANSYRIRSAGLENAATGNNEQASWILQYELGSWAWPRVAARTGAGNFILDGLVYDGNNLSAYEDFCLQKLDYNHPTFQTNYTLTGITLGAPLTNIYIGAEGYTNISTLADSSAVLAGFMVLNTPITNILQWKAAYRTLMWMFPDQNYYFTIGDSTMGFGGNFEPNQQTTTNSPWVAFKNSNQFSNSLLTQCYAIGADAMDHYLPQGQDGMLSSNDLFKVDAGFIPNGKFKTRECFLSMGLNDLFGGPTASFITNLQNFAAVCSSNNILLDVMTVPNCFSNCAYGSVVNPSGEARRQIANAFIISNAFLFHRVIRKDLMVTQHTMDTNPATGANDSQATDGGIHMGGTNGWLKNIQFANLILGLAQPVQSDATVINPSGSPFYWTNVYSYPVTFTWSGGTVTAITNTVTLTSASGETTVPANGIVSVVYTGSPTFNWYYAPGMIAP